MHRRHSHIARVRMLCAVVPSDIRLATRAAREAVQVARCHHEHRPRGHRCEKDEHWEQMALDGRAEPEGARKHALFPRAAPLDPVPLFSVPCDAHASGRKSLSGQKSRPEALNRSHGACVRRRRYRRRQDASKSRGRRTQCVSGGNGAPWCAPVALSPSVRCGPEARGRCGERNGCARGSSRGPGECRTARPNPWARLRRVEA